METHWSSIACAHCEDAGDGSSDGAASHCVDFERSKVEMALASEAAIVLLIFGSDLRRCNWQIAGNAFEQKLESLVREFLALPTTRMVTLVVPPSSAHGIGSELKPLLGNITERTEIRPLIDLSDAIENAGTTCEGIAAMAETTATALLTDWSEVEEDRMALQI